jgi:hypothetical protein
MRTNYAIDIENLLVDKWGYLKSTEIKGGILTQPFIISYPYLFEGHGQKSTLSDDPEKISYSMSMIFHPKNFNRAIFEKNWEEKIKDKYGVKRPVFPEGKRVRDRFKRGVQKTEDVTDGVDLDKNPAYTGMIIMAARANKPPQVVNGSKELITYDQLHPGDVCIALVIPSVFDHRESGAKGATMYVNLVQRIGAGIALSSYAAPEDVFACIVDTDAAAHTDL